MESLFDKLFLENSVICESLPPFDDLAQRGKLIGDTISTMVDILRSPMTTPNQRITDLATLEWRLIGNNMTPTAMAPGIPQVHFAAQVTSDLSEYKAIILVPPDFYERVRKDFIFNAGALVFVGSQGRDWYNQKMAWIENGEVVDARQQVCDRARAYEAEWLLMIKNLDIGYEFNEYQQGILEHYPEGLDSRPDLIYDSKPFAPGPPTIPRFNPESN